VENLRRSQRTSPQVPKTTTTAELTTMVDDISMVADTTTTPKIPQNQKTVQNGATERKDLRESKKTVMKIALNVVVNVVMDLDVLDRDVKEEQADVGTSR